MRKIKPISKYYLGKDGRLHPKSELAKGIRVGLMMAALIFGTGYTADTSSHASTYTPVYYKHKYENYVSELNPKLQQSQVREIIGAVYKWAKDLDPKLVLAVASVESKFDPLAISTSGAYGLMQVIPVWHKPKIVEAKKELGNPEVFNINTNIYLGTKVLKECLDKTGNIQNALQCYSGQTPGYSTKVLDEYRRLSKI